MVEVVLESLPSHIEEARIQNWFFEEGDPVNEGDDLLEITAGGGSVLIHASASGVLAEVYFDEGESVSKGEVLCTIDNEEDLEDEDEDDDDEEESGKDK